MGSNRGKKNKKHGKLAWSNRKANKGRRPTHGKRAHMPTWAEVRKTMLAKATVIVTPEKTDDAAKAE